VGCTKNANFASVHGQVLLDGQPLTQGTIITMPAAGRGANGTIQSDGSFELTTGDVDGASLGSHKVAVAAYEAAARQGPESGSGKLLIPQRYTSPETSELTIEVNADGENNPVLELSSK
jgi:hypothetical protein